MSLLKVGRYNVELTKEDLIWYPKSRITKGDIVEYYAQVAKLILPYSKNRPLTMHRFPEGIAKEGFYHKNAPDYFPKWIKTVAIEKQEGGDVNYVLADNAATIVYIANQGCITPHLFLSKIDKLDYPDQIIFDLDPPEKNFEIVREAALWLHDLLCQLGLVPFVKTTGSRGLHVVIPIKPELHFDDVRACARDISQILVNRYPKKLTLEIRKEKRDGRLFMDIMRNSFGATAVAPYAVRAIEGAPVATPLDWYELQDKKLRSDMYTIKNLSERLATIEDPWKKMPRSIRSLNNVLKMLQEMIKDV